PVDRAGAARPRHRREAHPPHDRRQPGVPARTRGATVVITAPKVIIRTAVTGSVHVPSQSDYLPLTPEQIVESAVEAAEAGSAIIHLHARHPADGRPAFEPEVFEQIIPPIMDRCDAVINITTGGSSAMTIEQRLAAALRFSPELASLNMGSMNFVYSGIADKITNW